MVSITLRTANKCIPEWDTVEILDCVLLSFQLQRVLVRFETKLGQLVVELFRNPIPIEHFLVELLPEIEFSSVVVDLVLTVAYGF